MVLSLSKEDRQAFLDACREGYLFLERSKNTKEVRKAWYRYCEDHKQPCFIVELKNGTGAFGYYLESAGVLLTERGAQVVYETFNSYPAKRRDESATSVDTDWGCVILEVDQLKAHAGTLRKSLLEILGLSKEDDQVEDDDDGPFHLYPILRVDMTILDIVSPPA